MAKASIVESWITFLIYLKVWRADFKGLSFPEIKYLSKGYLKYLNLCKCLRGEFHFQQHDKGALKGLLTRIQLDPR